jgi:hypothetical protein
VKSLQEVPAISFVVLAAFAVVLGLIEYRRRKSAWRAAAYSVLLVVLGLAAYLIATAVV